MLEINRHARWIQLHVLKRKCGIDISWVFDGVFANFSGGIAVLGTPNVPPLFLYQPAWQAPRVSLAPIPIQTPAMLASHADVLRGGYCHAGYFFTYKTDITL